MKQKHKNRLNNKIIGFSILFSMLALATFGVFFAYHNSNRQAQASGVTPTISPNTVNVGISTPITITYNTSTTMSIGSIIYLTYNSNYTGTISTSNTSVNGVTPSSVTNTSSAGMTTATIILANSISTGNAVNVLTTGLTTPVSAGNYTFSIVSSVNDAGANFQYVGQSNVVDVYAFVPVTLSFVIRNSADTVDTNVCDMNTVPVGLVVSCSYRLKIATNAKNGYVVSMFTDGDFVNGSYAANNAIAGPTGSPIVAGTETYGATINPGTVSTIGGSTTLATAYTAAGSNVVNYSNTTETPVYSANKPNNPGLTGDVNNTSLVTHRFAISSVTPSGQYRQRVTYIVTPSF